MIGDTSSSSTESSDEDESKMDVNFCMFTQFLDEVGLEDDFQPRWTLSDLTPNEPID